MFKEEGEEYERSGDYEQAIETYTTAIICWYNEIMRKITSEDY